MNYIALGCWSGNILHSDPWLQGPLAPYLVKGRILNGPVQNKRTYASRFFELFTLPASLKLNTQRRSAPSIRASKEEEERSVFISVTLMKGISGYKITVSIIGITFCMWRVQPCDRDLKQKFLSLIVCLFYPHIFFFFSSYLFCYPHFFSIRIFLSAISHPHPPSVGIRSASYRHPPWRSAEIERFEILWSFLTVNPNLL